MAIVVETGTGSSTSESYASIVNYTSYLSKYGYDADAGTDAEIEGALRRAMSYIEAFKFYGSRTTNTQSLSFPRYNVDIDGMTIDSDEIPTGLINATCEATRLERASTGILLPSVSKNIKRKQISVLETEYFGPSGETVSYTQIKSFLKGLIYTTGVVEFSRG